MARDALSKYVGTRVKVFGVVRKFGRAMVLGKTLGDTVNITGIRLCRTGELLTDHMWFYRALFPAWVSLGDRITFEGEVNQYLKGRFEKRGKKVQRNISYDYRLTDVRSVQRIT